MWSEFWPEKHLKSANWWVIIGWYVIVKIHFPILKPESVDTVTDFLIKLGMKPCLHQVLISIFLLNNVKFLQFLLQILDRYVFHNKCNRPWYFVMLNSPSQKGFSRDLFAYVQNIYHPDVSYPVVHASMNHCSVVHDASYFKRALLYIFLLFSSFVFLVGIL